MNQAEIIASLPAHLRPFVKNQDYARYTPRDQAVWRFIMSHLTRQLADTAHPVYLEGLQRTGIALDHIPSIDEMNEALAKLGWRAVVVDGFIPPAIFMEFQALKVLVIALDMRTVDHILYTPAPDIVHESAGHAPFIVDVDYAEFLQLFGEIGMKAIASEADFAVYEAIRALSIIKESPASTAEDIAAAEDNLHKVTAENTDLSEAALLARLHWWTVEYGLVGELDDYGIFGAGLLSSLGESIHCLDDSRVRKVPLTVDAVNVPYDITRQQPQLFVTRSCKHLSQVLQEFAASMAFRRGGAESLYKAREAGSVCTAQYDSGVQVSGRIVDVLTDAVGNVTWFRTAGPTQLAFRDREIYDHGIQTHAEGFSAPVGMLKDFSRCLSEYTVDELRAHAIELDKPVRLEFLSGITVAGTLRAIHRQEHHNLLLSFDDCTATGLEGKVLYQPEWGRFDMAVGARIESVFGGTADREAYQLYEPLPSSTPEVDPPDSTLMALYLWIDRAARDETTVQPEDVTTLQDGLARFPGEWLLRVELQRLARRSPDLAPLLHQAALELTEMSGDAALAPLLTLALDALPEVA